MAAVIPRRRMKAVFADGGDFTAPDLSNLPDLANTNLSLHDWRGNRTLGQRIRSGFNATGRYLGSKQFSNGLEAVTPYVSNLVTFFRQPPQVPTPIAEDYVPASTVRYDAARAAIDRAGVGADKSTNRTLTGQAAQAVQAANLGTRLDAYSNVAEQEANTNAQIRNQQAALNSSIAVRNNERANNYRMENLSRNIAQQRVSSENLANMADKAIMDQARKGQLRLDREKFDILSRMYEKGLLARNMKGLTIPGTDEEQKARGGQIRKLRKVFS